MSDITISYKGNSIATMDATGTKTLLTEGKYCEDDITIDYVQPSGQPDDLEIDLATAYEWEIGAVGGETNKSYDQVKQSNNARLRGTTLIQTNNVPFTLKANWGNGEWVVQYARYNSSEKGASGFTPLTSDTELVTSPYIALVCRHSDGTTAMNVSDINIIKPKLYLDLAALSIVLGGE